jgi:nuclear RNA export factor
MQASVTGIFRERAERSSPLRWFQRVFIIVPQASGGFCIVNEQLHISNATTEQLKSAFKGVEPAPAALESVVAPAMGPSVNETIVDPVLRQQMIQSFAEQSGMNADWSIK